MKVTLVNTNRYKEPPVVPVGLEYLVAPLERSGHEVGLCDLAFSPDPARDLAASIDQTGPDIIGLTVRNVDNVLFHRNDFFLDEIAELVRVARSCSNVPIVAGGTSTLCSTEGLRKYLGVDCVVAGPGERAFPELLDAVSGGAPPPASVDGWKAGIIADIVHPRGRLVDYRRYVEGGNPAGLEFRKGCDWGCGFCVERGRPVLKRKVSAVVAEAWELVRAGVSMFFFCDSEVNLDMEDTCVLLEALARAETGLRWSGYFRPVPFDPETAHIVSGSGCGDLTLSVNSWDLSREGGPYGADDVKRFVELCENHEIKVSVDLLVGYPGEELPSVDGAISLLSSLRPATVAVNEFIRLYENTPVATLAASASTIGSITGKLDGNASMLKPVYFTCVQRDWLSERISGEPGFVLADAERTVNYLRVSE